jgi:hypothetical protein
MLPRIWISYRIFAGHSGQDDLTAIRSARAGGIDLGLHLLLHSSANRRWPEGDVYVQARQGHGIINPR